MMNAYVFGARVALLAISCGVVYAFLPRARNFVRHSLWGAADSDRLAAGLCFVAFGSVLANIITVLSMILGYNIADEFGLALTWLFVGLGAMIVGHFLNFTAWLAVTSGISPSRATVLTFTAVASFGTAAVVLYWWIS